MTNILAPISVGELLDKITILKIKLDKLRNDDQRGNVARELDQLTKIRAQARLNDVDLAHLEQELFALNLQLWDVEDRLRDLERAKNFGRDFIERARSVYILNDRRTALKKQINRISGSAIVEEKSYPSYG
jgi:hypothetical protein